jgi:C-terminal processing protease CtpA/Prc
MAELLEHLDDKHVYIHKFNNVFFSGYDLPILGYSQLLKFDFRLPLNDFSLKLIKKKHIRGKFKKAFFVRQLNVPPFGLRYVFHYGWLDHDIAYIYISEMRNDDKKTEKAVNEILKYFKKAKSYIIDIRDNIGGYANPIKESLARKFADRDRVWAISYKRSGPAHTDFSEPEHWSIEPDERIDLSQMPVVLLTNKNTQSAAELFALMMGVLPNVTVVGDKTMGIFSDTQVDKLPNGWEFRLSIRKTTNHEGVWLENKGITPDVFVKNIEVDIKGGKDKVLEKAIELIVTGNL